MMRGIPLTHEQIQKIRKEVMKAKSKYQVAKEMGLDDHTVSDHTRDLPSRRRSDPCIQGKSFEILKQLLKTGVVPCTNENRARMRTLRRHLPMIRHSGFNNRAIFYLDDKNKQALQALLESNPSKIVSYCELGQMMRIFNVKAGLEVKKAFLGRKLRG